MDKELNVMKVGLHHNSINQLRDYNFGNVKKNEKDYILNSRGYSESVHQENGQLND
jgi:hypothetical protein